jgi:hypothetical protein
MEYEPVQPFFLIAVAEEAAAKGFIDVGPSIKHIAGKSL